MKSLIKFSLLALLCSVALETTVQQQAQAGIDPAGITVPDSSTIGANFEPSAGGTTGSSASPSIVLAQPEVIAAISNAIDTVRTALQAGTIPEGAIAAVEPQPLSPEAVEAISAVLSATTSNVETVAPVLSNQISSEIFASLGSNSLSAETTAALNAATEAIANLSVSAASLPEAIAAVNALVRTAYENGELTALAKSPSFVAARQAVVEAEKDAGEAAEENCSDRETQFGNESYCLPG